MQSYQKQKAYADFYNEGRVLSLPEFLVEHGYDPMTIGPESKQRAFIEKDWPGCEFIIQLIRGWVEEARQSNVHCLRW